MASIPGIGAEPLDIVEVALVSDVGAIRTSNEDSALAEAFGLDSAHPWGLSAVLLVADGVGGHDAGEVASGIARSRIEEAFVPQFDAVPEEISEDDLWKHIDDVIGQINAEICAYNPESSSRPATTLTLCIVRGSRYYVGHVGDTRAYVVRGEAIEQITVDDTWVAEAIRSGTMTPEQADRSPFRNHLMKAVGIKPMLVPSHYSGDWDHDDILAICSDGLSDYVQQQEIWHELRHTQSLDEACTELVQRAIERGGHDNISLVAMARPGRERRDPAIPAPVAFQRPGKLEPEPPAQASAGNGDFQIAGKPVNMTSVGEVPIPAGFLAGQGGAVAPPQAPTKPLQVTSPVKPVPVTSPGMAPPTLPEIAPPSGSMDRTRSSHEAQTDGKPMSWRVPIIVLAVLAVVIAAVYIRHIAKHTRATSGSSGRTSIR